MEIGYVMALAERGPKHPEKRYKWLARAGLEKRYWQMRHSGATKNANGLVRLLQVAATHKIKDNHTFDVDTLTQRSDVATKAYAMIAH